MTSPRKGKEIGLREIGLQDIIRCYKHLFTGQNSPPSGGARGGKHFFHTKNY